MAKHRIQPTRWIAAWQVLIFAGLLLGLGIAPAQAGEHTSPSPGAKTTRSRATKSAARRKTAAVSGPELPPGKRDPFKLPEVPTGKPSNPENNMALASTGILPAGTRGLLIAQLRLEGVVRQETANKMIAVVTNDTRRAYFLRQNDAVYNGVVSKITPDAVFFQENVLDPNGRATTREVVKRLNPAPGEGR